MANFTYNGQKFQSVRMNLLTEAKLAKRLIPILAHVKALSKAWAGVTKMKVESEDSGDDEENREAAVKAAESLRDSLWVDFADALGKLPDEDLEFIINECMTVVQREDPQGGWSWIWDHETRRPHYKDVNLPMIFAVVGAVIQSEFSDFFS